MAKGPRRGQNIVVKTQFNINGSRGKDVSGFIADYVARDAATDTSLAYIPPLNRPVEVGDGVAFTLDATAISKRETLRLASKVQTLHSQGNRAIQQIVISFDPIYLVEQGIVPEGIEIMEKGDYKYNYDDVRLRHAVRSGIQTMVENDGYYDGNMVAAIQSDTMHLHVHAVVYENSSNIARRRNGKEERGMLKQSSLNRLSYDIDRHLSSTRDLSCTPTQRLLSPEYLDDGKHYVFNDKTVEDLAFLNGYLELLEEEKMREELDNEVIDDILDDIRLGEDIELDDF